MNDTYDTDVTDEPREAPQAQREDGDAPVQDAALAEARPALRSVPSDTDIAEDETPPDARAMPDETGTEDDAGHDDPTDAPEAAVEEGPRLPRICLMGEFSAGKSTLTNLLTGGRALPVNVTATQLPPVWLSFGTSEPYRVTLEGEKIPVDLDRIEEISVHDTRFVRIFMEADVLKTCDLIDMPGISDPNMSSEVWQRVLPEADAVIWCTHATQAWRQSEAAVWSRVPADIQRHSVLLLTRMDKILSERDRQRVVRRVERETQGLFRARLPISLTQALAGRNDPDAWRASGAKALYDDLAALVSALAAGEDAVADADAARERPPTRPVSQVRTVLPRRVRPRPLTRKPLSRRPQDGVPLRP